MAKTKRLASDEITAIWTSPEQVRAALIQEAVDAGASAQEVADLSSANVVGRYTEVLGESVVENVERPELGELLVWVHPSDAATGWFERYDGDLENYTPIVTTPEG